MFKLIKLYIILKLNCIKGVKFMITDYIIHFSTLPKAEQIEQLITILIFLFVLLIICSILAFLKYKFLNKDKKNRFQKFLQKL